VYEGLVINGTVPEEYQTKYIPVSERQFALGGARLAYLMTTIFPNSKEESVFLQ